MLGGILEIEKFYFFNEEFKYFIYGYKFSKFF